MLITRSGEVDHVDGTALASLAAGNMAATNGIASLIGEGQFGALFHQGSRENVHISVMGERMILVCPVGDTDVSDDASSNLFWCQQQQLQWCMPSPATRRLAT